jgi:L-serine dehydratase
MTAGALVYLKGGDAEMIVNSVAMALKNMMGLVCDPVAGLVEVPCVKRNVAGAMTALSSADMALAGIRSRIPADEVIDAMKEVGDKMHPDFKETARGGVANTKTGIRLKEEILGTEM